LVSQSVQQYDAHHPNPTALAKDPHISRRKIARSKSSKQPNMRKYQESNDEINIESKQRERRRSLEHRNKIHMEFAGHRLTLNAVWSILSLSS